MGPSNGMPLIIRLAEAALMASTSCGFSMSAPRMVSTTWVSLRKPSGNAGRRGRSVSRQVRMASSVGRPSRRKNEPGILPAAYARSSTSMVRGKKSVPGRTSLAALAVASTVVRPRVATTAPWLCWASLPVSKDRVLSVPVRVPDTRMASAMTSLSFCGGARRATATKSGGPGSQSAMSALQPGPAGPAAGSPGTHD